MMLIAVAKEGNQVAQHFGHCLGFELIQLNEGEVGTAQYVENPGHRPGFLPGFLAEKGVNLIISGGMGASAQELFARNGIQVIVGARGDIQDVVEQYLQGTLKSTGETCGEHQHAGECGH